MFNPFIPQFSIPRRKDKIKPRIKGFWLRINQIFLEGCWKSRKVMSPGF